MSEKESREELRKKILKEMTYDYSKILEQNLSLAKQFVRIHKSGEVEVLVKEQVTGKEKILLYLIGKLYAKEAGLSATDEVGNEELMDKLGLPSGSLLPWLKSLRDSNRILQVQRERYTYHSISASEIERTLNVIMKKIKPKSE